MKSLFVKNLPYDLTNEEFQEAFEQFGDVVGVNIATEWHYGRRRSRGYGFVDFRAPEGLRKCLESSESIVLKGRTVEFREARDRPQISDQVFISGIAAAATDASLREHFRSCNPVEARIVRPASGDRPGFGCAVFRSQADRDRAIRDLNGSVLAGGNLVVREASRPFRTEEDQREYYRVMNRGDRWHD
jgi:RNA recognition motif-containing protein